MEKERERRLKQEADIGPNMVEIPVQHVPKQKDTDTKP